MSIRLRLTLLYSTILALTLIAFSILLYVTLSRLTLNVTAATLAEEAKRLLDRKVIDARIFVFDNQEYRVGRIVLPADTFAAPQTFVQTISANGLVTSRSVNLVDKQVFLPLSDTGFQAVFNGQTWFEQAQIQDRPLLIYTKPVYVEGGRIVGAVQLARSLDGYVQSQNTLRQILIIGSSFATVIAFGIGWVLAGIALRPIDRITQTAQAIGAERDFGRRVNYIGPHDEIGRLTTTFNEMLGVLQAAYRQEAQALQAQRRFVADASHELRTPLTTIRGNIALLQREPPISNEDRIAVLADMADESERMSRLVNDLLVLARADAGRPLRSERVAIKPLIEDVCRKVKVLAPHHTIDCSDLDDVDVRGDQDAIKQVLLILLDNARKFTPPGGQINVSMSDGAEQIALHVRDTGIGIDPAALPYIFERFYRGDTSRTGGGAGLGLSIAQTLVKSQNGTISVESTPGAGSTFTITLPKAGAAQLPVETAIASSAASH
jgi:two-component system, OmpR family, sensor kinase